MPDHPLVLQLLDELLDSEVTPEDVCGEHPELLSQVRQRWQQICRARSDLDSLFRPITEFGANVSVGRRDPAALPEIPGYAVEEVLGVGGMGVVFKAQHQRLNRTVALKMALAGAYASPHERERFQREAEAFASLRHANVVQIYDVGEEAGRPYFTMEYIDGGSLAEKMAGTPQSAVQCAMLVATISHAVQAAHDAGIVHRDLKPANVLLTVDGTPKVSDFGLARRLGGEAGLTRTGAVIGTPSYMAPEQARGDTSTTGAAVDIYALGAILYELLTGRPPFLAETAAQTVYQLLSQEPVPPSKLVSRLPRDLETICLKCLRKEPRLRYASAEELADDLVRFHNGMPILARRLSWVTRAWRWCRRHPAGAMLIVSALAVIVTIAFVGRSLERQELIRREEAARNEGRSLQAMEAALEKAATLREQGRWPEVQAALGGAQNLLSPSAPPAIRKQVERAIADAEMVSDLEEIRLQLSSNQISHSPEKMYAEAFKAYGIDLLTLDPRDARDRLRNSPIRDTLLVFLHDWLHWMPDANRQKLRSILDQTDDDEWRRNYRIAASVPDVAKLKSLASAPEAAAQPPVILSGLAGSLLAYHQRENAVRLLSAAQKLHPGDFWINYLLGHFWGQERPQLALGYFRAAIAIRPSSDQAYLMLGRALRRAGDADDSIAAFRNALAINPDCAVGRDLAMLLAERGDLDEARLVWENSLDRNGQDHGEWQGYPELCLFLRDEKAYQHAREALLDRFEHMDSHWTMPERTSIWCLLRPASGDELRRIVALVERAVESGPKTPHPDAAYLQFVEGFAEYRVGRPEQAIPLLKNAASLLSNRPGPKLVLAMAQFQSGAQDEARKTLAEVLLSYDWKNGQGDLPTMWASHALLREAEQLIISDLPALSDEK